MMSLVVLARQSLPHQSYKSEEKKEQQTHSGPASRCLWGKRRRVIAVNRSSRRRVRMNRLLQKFVGSDSPSAATPPHRYSNGTTPNNNGGYGNNRQYPASSGASSSNNTNWASTAAYSNPSQQYYGQQQHSNGAAYSSHYGQQQQQQSGYASSGGLDEIPLSSPVASSKPTADSLFEDSQYAQQQQSYQSHEAYGYGQQQYGAYEQQQYPAAADSFFQGHYGTNDTAPRSSSGQTNPFVNPSPASTVAPSAYRGFDSQQSASDLFVNAAPSPFSTPSSFNGFSQHYEQPSPARSTSADPFAHPPPPSKTNSFNGFSQQHYEQPSPARSTFTGAADPFANPPRSTTSSYNGFGPNYEEPSPARSTSASADPFANPPPPAFNGFSQHSQEPSPARSTSASADLFANPPPSQTSSFNGFSQQHYEEPSPARSASESADPFASSSSSQNGFFSQQHQETAAASSSNDLFGSASSAATQAYNGFSQDYYEYPQEAAPAAPFASASQSTVNPFNGFSSQQQGASVHNSQESSVDPFANHAHASMSAYNGYDQQQNEYVNEDANPFASTDSKADSFATYPDADYEQHASNDLFSGQPAADPFPSTSEYQAEVPRSSSPTQVNDFFADGASSASNLFNSEPEAHMKTSIASPKAELSQQESESPRKQEAHSSLPAKQSLTISTLPEKGHDKLKQDDPVAGDEEEITLRLQKTTLDDSVKLAEMYKQMAERLEGEKNDLLKVLADQADQFYQMQEYISSLEQELEVYRSRGQQPQ